MYTHTAQHTFSYQVPRTTCSNPPPSFRSKWRKIFTTFHNLHLSFGPDPVAYNVHIIQFLIHPGSPSAAIIKITSISAASLFKILVYQCGLQHVRSLQRLRRMQKIKFIPIAEIFCGAIPTLRRVTSEADLKSLRRTFKNRIYDCDAMHVCVMWFACSDNRAENIRAVIIHRSHWRNPIPHPAATISTTSSTPKISLISLSSLYNRQRSTK